MNFLNPDDYREEDPDEWILSSLVFARALGFALKDTEGIVIDIANEIKDTDICDHDKIIVYKWGDQIKICECENKELPDGTLIWMHNYEGEQN